MLPRVRAGSVSRCLTADPPGPPGPGLFCEPELQLRCNEEVNTAERLPRPSRRRCRKRLSRRKFRVAKYSSGEEQLEQSEVLGAWLRNLFSLECRSDAPSLLEALKLQKPVGEKQWHLEVPEFRLQRQTSPVEILQATDD